MNTIQENPLVIFVITGMDRAQTAALENEPTPPIALQPGEHRLEYGDIVSLKRGGQRLRVISGYAWISFDGEDTVVQAGQDIILEPGTDAAVITALEEEPLVYRLYEEPAAPQ